MIETINPLKIRIYLLEYVKKYEIYVKCIEMYLLYM